MSIASDRSIMSTTVLETESGAEREATAAGKRPFVSIIIPVKNDARRLQVCLKSLKKQQYPADRFEIIVIDNGSSDDSAAVAATTGSKVLQRPGIHVGALRNEGVGVSNGSVLAFVDADHELPPSWLITGVEALTSNGAVCAAGAPCMAPPAGTWVQRCWEVHRLRGSRRRSVDWLGAGNLFVLRDAFTAAGGFREDLVAAEDVDLCLRLAERSGSILNDPRIENIHHGEPATLWQFIRKEYWRGSSGVRAFWKQGLPLRELPSLLYPAYYLLVALGLVVAVATLAWHGWLTPIFVLLAALVLPAALLSIKTSWQCRQMRAILPLTILYVAYGLARAAALFKQ